jgi:hypothetical protein
MELEQGDQGCVREYASECGARHLANCAAAKFDRDDPEQLHAAIIETLAAWLPELSREAMERLARDARSCCYRGVTKQASPGVAGSVR